MRGRKPYILFLARSREQKKRFNFLISKMGIDGSVINGKRPGVGKTWKAILWVWKKRDEIPLWISFHLMKARIRGRRTGALLRLVLVVSTVRFMARILKEADTTIPEAMVIWNGESYKFRAARSWAKEKNVQVIFMENGFLPSTIAIDGKGINCNNSIPRRAAFYKEYDIKGLPFEGRSLISRKSKVNPDAEIELPKHYFFIPFQVPTDTQVLLNSHWIKSMEAFYQVLQSCLSALPAAYTFVVKEHPTAEIRYPHLHNIESRIVFANGNNTADLIRKAGAVLTLNSTVGIESLLMGVPVITLGEACYNIDGLVHHADNITELRALLSNPGQINVDKLLVRHFLTWLEREYLIPGSWRNPQDETAVAMKRRIEHIMGNN